MNKIEDIQLKNVQQYVPPLPDFHEPRHSSNNKFNVQDLTATIDDQHSQHTYDGGYEMKSDPDMRVMIHRGTV